MPRTVNVNYVTKEVKILLHDSETESLAAATAIAAAAEAQEAKDVVVDNLQDSLDAIDAKTEDEKDELDDYTSEKKGEYISEATTILNAIQAQYGYPFVAATAAAMTDTTKIYVYTGSETGYTAGNWYYNNGTAWVSGGVFNSNEATTKAEMSLFGVDDLLWDSSTGREATPKTSAGVTYNVDFISKTVAVSGTSTGISYYRYFYSLSSLPAGMVAGETYTAHLDTQANVTFYMAYYKNNQSGGTALVNNKKGVFEFTIPAEATGMLIRIGVANGDTANAVVRPFISKALTLEELNKATNDIFKNKGAFSPTLDLDTVVDKGHYFIVKNPDVTPSASNPVGNDFALLCVYPSVNGGVTQVVSAIEKPKSYIRRYSPAQSSWTEWVADDDINYMKKLGSGNSIPANSDFDELTETGYAFINAGDSGYVNAPPLNGGVLTVYNTGSIVTQYANSHKTTDNYVRRKFNNEWSEWTGVQNRKSLKYLAIGNSGTDDMLSYVPFILQNVAPDLDLTIGTTYISGGTIDQQIDAFDNDTLLSYHLYSPDSSTWKIYSQKTLKECLLAEDWDIISIQQASSYQMVWTNYAHVPDLIDRIVTYVGSNHTDYVGHPVKVGYLAPQVRVASSTLVDGKYQVIETPTTYSDYMDCVQRALDEYPLEFAIMSGTAVQTARKETTLDQYGDAQFSDGTSGHMNADNTHLQEGIGCIVASYASTLFLLELAGINNRSVLGEGTRPNSAWITAHNIPGTNGSTVVGISDANCLIAQKCAIMAHKKPFEVSTIV